MSDRDIIREQLRIYRPAFLEHGDSPHASFHGDRAFQELRFDRLMQPIGGIKSGFSIHDVGAGLCDLHAWLASRGVDHRYSATEIVPEMVEHARKKFPDIEVHCRDLLRDEVPDRHDFVVASGVFNLPGAVEPEAWDRFIRDMLRKMFEMSQVAIAFNFLTSHRTYSDPALHYVEPGAMLDFCVKELSRFVLVDHAYPLYEYGLTVFRPEFVAAGYDAGTFGKYFRTK